MDVWSHEIAQIADSVGDLARLDVVHLPQDELLTAYDAVARLGRLTGALQARFAGEIARRSSPDLPGGGLARQQGFGSAGAFIAQTTGTTQAQARRAIEAGQALAPADASSLCFDPGAVPSGATAMSSVESPRYPAIADATLTGALSVEAAGLIVAGLESIVDTVAGDTLRDLEQRLVARAVVLSVADVRRLVARAVARADVERHKEREQRQYGERYLSWVEDHTGMVTLNARLDPVTAAPLRTAIEQIVTQDFRARREQDPREADQRSIGQMRADALSLICRHALGCSETDVSGVRTALVVRVNREDLESGDGLAQIDGVGALVSMGELRRLAGDAAVIPAVLGGPSEVLDLGRSVRLFTRAQRLALLERDGGCAKCHAPPERCEAHHIKPWDAGGRSDLGNGVMLCTRCHHDVHRQGWEIIASAEHVEFVPPASIDPLRRVRLGGVAALDVDRAA